MPSDKYRLITVSIEQLLLDDQNPRLVKKFGGADQSTLVNAIADDCNLPRIAKEVIELEEYPIRSDFCVLQKDDKFVVLEGNRRIAAYKCLVSPDLLSDEKKRAELETLAEQAKYTAEKKLEVILVLAREDARKLIWIKHVDSAFEKWTAPAKDDFVRLNSPEEIKEFTGDMKKRAARAHMRDKIKGLALPKEISETANDQYKFETTTFERIAESRAGKSFLGYKVKADGKLEIEDEAIFLERLTTIVCDVVKGHSEAWGKEINSRSLHKKSDIQKYLASLDPKKRKENAGSESSESDEDGDGEGAGTLAKTALKNLPNLNTPCPSDTYSIKEIESAVELVAYRFKFVYAELQRRHDKRPTLVIENEYDVQDLFGSLLKIFFDDVRDEEGMESHADSSGRIDFLLHKEEVGIEIKYFAPHSSPSRRTDLLDEINADIPRYRAHSKCKRIYFFVFDPDGGISNPASFLDIQKQSSTKSSKVTVIIQTK